MNGKSRWSGALLCAALLLGSQAAFADDVAGAASAYARAQKAELGGDHAQAAELYELADSMAPASAALRSALRARKAAGQLAIAASHAEALLKRYPEDAKSKALADETLAEAKKTLARSRISCEPEACLLVVDDHATGTDARAEHVVYLSPGAHRVQASFNGRTTTAQNVDAEAGGSFDLSFSAPPAEAPSKPDPETPAPVTRGGDVTRDTSSSKASGGLSPWFFVGGTVVTVGLGAVATWSGLDTLSKHDTYKQNPTDAGYKEGQDLERRTNILFAATGVAALATITIAVFTDWGGKKESARLKAGVAPAPGGSLLSVSGAF